MRRPELLIPVGDLECLKAAVQNGADAVYLGLSEFNARYSAQNFTLENLEEATRYAHLRHVSVHLTLNTLIKDEEFEQAVLLAKKAYELGVDAMIVQDLGLAKFLIKNFPNLPIHASTQMTCHNLMGVKYLEKLGFQRVVLARELSLSEIAYIKSNTKAEIEVFGHGALCISYSGQCLYSSAIGGRSGNRGKCAQGCRLPYELLENEETINKGYLLSPRDLCSLENSPDLLATGIDSLKIEGRMKSPEYVATVTRIYRKQIDKIMNDETYTIEDQDKQDLLQVFNRGGFSSGHLKETPNKNLVFKDRPNHMGIFLGQVDYYFKSNGHISFTSKNQVEIGDTITFEKEPTKYTVSELMQSNKNISTFNVGDKIEIGRMKGNIAPGDKIYKLASKSLASAATNSYAKEIKKTPLHAVLELHLEEPICLRIFDKQGNTLTVNSSEIPEVAMNSPISKERLEKQLNKTGDVPFYFEDIKIHMDSNVYVPHIRTVNELRRNAIAQYSDFLCKKYKKTSPAFSIESKQNNIQHPFKKITVLLNQLHNDYDYSKLQEIDQLYLPLKYFCDSKYEPLLKIITNEFCTYIYLPSIMKANYRNLFKNHIDSALKKFTVKGFVVSNIGYFELLKDYEKDYELISNYTLNIFNTHTIHELPTDTITLSPELNEEELNSLASSTHKSIELIVYGNLPLMTMQYCLLGNSNQCYPECTQKCKTNNMYYLKDRMNFKFRIVPDNIQTTTTLYNSKTTFIDTHSLTFDNARIDILNETIDEINHIITTVKKQERFEGKDYTNGNLHRTV